MSTLWVLVIVWACHMDNAANCVGVYGPYPTLEACQTASTPTIVTLITGRACKPLEIEKSRVGVISKCSPLERFKACYDPDAPRPDFRLSSAHPSLRVRSNAGETKATGRARLRGGERIDVIPPEASTLTSPPVFVT